MTAITLIGTTHVVAMPRTFADLIRAESPPTPQAAGAAPAGPPVPARTGGREPAMSPPSSQ
jgi:hypothetical protein